MKCVWCGNRSQTCATVKLTALVLAVAAMSGCRPLHDWSGPFARGREVVSVANPLPVPLVPRELVMDEVADEIDNYFHIAREQRIQLIDNVLTEGWIETHPRIGSTLLEPWRHDSTPGFERVHATLQTVRRFARVRVIPTGDGYLVDVQVFKELENLPRPQHATVSGRVMRHDNTLDEEEWEQPRVQPRRGWIPMGRDISLEQKILSNIQSRIHSAIQASDKHL